MNPQLLASLQSPLPQHAVVAHMGTNRSKKRRFRQFYGVSGHLWLLNPSQEAPKWVGNQQGTLLLAVGPGRACPHLAP